MKKWFYVWSVLVFVAIALFSLLSNYFLWLYAVAGPLFILGLYDIFQRKHTILRNFPLLAYFRYMIEFVRPQIRQYMIESDLDGRPYYRELRSVIYERAKNELDTLPYGTRNDVYQIGYEWVNHSLTAKRSLYSEPRVMIGNEQCRQPYHASILNISAMSFGAISDKAVMAMNKGAKIGNFYQNTGEGGLTEYHLKHGGDIVWQIGTAYFGCRNPDGSFNGNIFKEKVKHPSIKMVEIKLSQGAKPGHGGILPGKKVTEEIARIRLVPVGQDVLSPTVHSTFDSPLGLIDFIQELRDLSGGKPVGFKLCVGLYYEFMAICKAMIERNIYPDFITVDGAEGGTGAAPLEFSDSVGMPADDGLVFVHNALVGAGIRQHIRVISAGKMGTGFHILRALARGADLCNMARAFMMATGCIQALKCNTNRCPTGVTTQDPGLTYGLHVDQKSGRVAEYHRETVRALCELVAAVGLDDPSQIRPYHVFRRVSAAKVDHLNEIYTFLEPSQLLTDNIPEPYATHWRLASASQFDAVPN